MTLFGRVHMPSFAGATESAPRRFSPRSIFLDALNVFLLFLSLFGRGE